MDRGREGRRGSVGGGSVSAPRRPRTIGFKDASVGEDADDAAEDLSNSRLRERAKKDNSTITSVQGVSTSGGGSVFRGKRKRQGSQDIHDQGRGGAVDDVDETTEDTDMGVSDDDDDPPPPPIPRRAAKFRPQGKFSEDGPNVDLPAVPRKARTAILKRPQEAASPSVVDGSSHQGSAAILRTSTPSSAPSSSSVVSLKPGRRTKPITSKPRASKVAKVADQSAISEQEVEVAEALFDLARLFTKQPNSIHQDVGFRGLNAGEAQENASAEPGVKVEPAAVVDCTNVSLAPFEAFTPLVPASNTVSSVVASQTAVPSSPPDLTGCSPPITSISTGPVAVSTDSTAVIPLRSSLPPACVAPPAEAPKRKRPRFRSRFDDLRLVAEGTKRETRVENVCNPGLPCAARSESGQTVHRMFHSKGEIPVEVDMGTAAALLATPASVPPLQYIPTAVYTEVPLPQMPVQRSSLLEELEICSTSEKVATKEIFTSTISKGESQMLSSTRVPVFATVGVAGSLAKNSEVEPALYSTSGITTESNVDVHGRCPRDLDTVIDEDRPKNLLVDLMVLPVAKSSLPMTSSRASYGSDSTADYKLDNESIQGKIRPLIDQEQKLNAHLDREPGKDREPDKKKKSIAEGDHERQKQNGQGTQPCPSSDTDQGHDGGEAQSKMGHLLEKSTEPSKSELKTLNMEGPAVVQATSAPQFAASGIQATGTDPTTGASCVATLPVSMGMAGWAPLGLQPMGYFSSGGGAVANVSWHGGASPTGGSITVDEQIATGLELQHPYIIQPRNLQSWKRCASHVYIAHFIDAQQQMNRHPFIQAAYQNSVNLHGQKSFTQKNPFAPGDGLFGVGSKPLLNGTVGTNGACLVTAGGSRSIVPGVHGNERTFSGTPVLTSTQAKESMYIEALARKQGVQLPQNPLSQARPGFGVSATHASTVGPAAVPTLNEAGHAGDSASGSGSMVYGISSGCSSGSNPTSGAGASNCGVVSHAAAQAQYLQAVMQQGGFPFPFQNSAHFGHGFSGPGHQQAAAQFYSSPFYTTHLVPSSAQPQQLPQQASNTSIPPGGLLSNQVEHPQQQAMPISPSHSHQLQKLQRPGNREENNAADSTSVTESKLSTQKGVYGQGTSSPSVSSSCLPPSLRLGGLASGNSPPSQDIIAVIGGKQAKQQKQSQNFSQQHYQNQAMRQHVPGQHTTSVAALGTKGMDQQSPRLLSGKSSTAGPSPGSGSVPGPGPLGLTPVAPMMAPQGHAVLQSVSDTSKSHGQNQHLEPQHHSSAVSHPTQQALDPGQHIQRSMQIGTSTGGVDEDRTAVVNGHPVPGRCGREVADERKASVKHGTGSRLHIDSTAAVAIQGPPGGVPLGSRVANSMSSALNLMTPTSAVVISRPAGHLPGGDLQQAGSILPANLNIKQTTARNKVLSGAATASAVTALSTPMVPFADRPLPAPSLPSKVSGPPLSLKGSNSGQGIHVPRQNPSPQYPQLKYSSKGSIASLSVPSGTAPQAVLAAAIAKSQQGAHQQHSRPQLQGGTNVATVPSFPSGNVGSLTVSVGISLPALSPPTKSSTTGTAKSTLCSKGSFSLAQKSGVVSKRCTPSGGVNVVSSLGPASLVQSPPTKLPVQPQQNSSPHHVPPLQQPAASLPQPLPHLLQPVSQQHAQNFHHQQASTNPQQANQVQTQHALMPQQQAHQLQRHAFLHSTGFQQHLHAQGSQTSSHTQQQTQQRSSVQLQSQVSTPPPQPQHQPQQHSTPQLHHQQQQHHNVHTSSGHFCGPASNGSFCLEPPVLTLGPGNNGSSSSSWAPGSDSGTPQSSTARPNSTASKGTGGSGIPSPGSNSQKASGPSFMHPQYGSGSSAVQQPVSPRSNPGSQYLPPANGAGVSGMPVDEKSISGAL